MPLTPLQKEILPIGCAFLDKDMVPRWIEESDGLRMHFGSIRGCWPHFADEAP
ncbi:MAG: hypothetical protein R3F19_24050 [Verrucomicrobiales bacterium]